MIDQIKALVRPVVTFGIVGAVIYGFVTKLIATDVFVPLATLVLVFWFESREKKTESQEYVINVSEDKKKKTK